MLSTLIAPDIVEYLVKASLEQRWRILSRVAVATLTGLFALAGAVTPFQPVLSAAPTTWTLSVLPIAATPSISMDIAARLPQADVTLLGSCSHSIAMEQTDKFLSAARSLFAAQLAALE